MDVFLVPVSATDYALYCEAEALPEPDDQTARPTLWARAVRVFRRVLAEGEEEERRKSTDAPPPDRGRLRRWIARRLASAVAEQRLLWRLRHESEAGLVHPDDVSAADAIALTHAEMARDYTRHVRWCVIDSLLAIAAIPVALVPGPNVLGYYFLFRAVGHLFSARGARHGRKDVTWHPRGTPHLTELRAVLGAPPPQRARDLIRIAELLGLERLTYFINRTARYTRGS